MARPGILWDVSQAVSQPPNPPEERDEPRPASKRWRPAALFAACAVGLTALATLALSIDAPFTRRDDPQTDNAYVGGDVTGISARVQGYLVRLPIADNQPVRAGQGGAEVEARDYTADRDEAQANLQAAEAQRAAVIGQQRELAAEIARTRSGELGSTAAVERTAPELARQRVLVHTDAGERRQLDQAEADQRTTLAGIAAAHAQVIVRQRQAAILDAQRRQAEALIEARRADLALANLNLGWTRIVSPADGTLGPRRVRVGDLLTAGTVIAEVTPLDTVWVDANFTERQIVNMRLGQAARLILDTFPRQVVHGHVAGLSPVTGGRLSAIAPYNTTGNFTKVVQRVPVRIAIDWQGSPLRGRLRPGMSAVATVLTAGGADGRGP